ncbi:hypothetical protein D3C86_1944910 [compost metagenome]
MKGVAGSSTCRSATKFLSLRITSSSKYKETLWAQIRMAPSSISESPPSEGAGLRALRVRLKADMKAERICA